MKLKVKILQGAECNVDITSGDSVETLKDLVKVGLNISPCDQRLLHKGKALQDGTSLDEYNLKEGDRLHLVVKKDSTPPCAGTETQTEVTPSVHLANEVFRVLKTHFRSESDARKVSSVFCKQIERRLANLSLDDIERVCEAWAREGKLVF